MSIPGAANPLLLASAASTQYTVSRSLRFNSSDSAYCGRNFTSAGNRTKWTFSAWIKRTTLGATANGQSIFCCADGGSNTTFLNLGINDTDQVFVGASGYAPIVTSNVFRDPSAWYHFVLTCDTGQASATNRLKFYVNGVEASYSTDSRSSITQNSDLGINQAVDHYLGRVTRFGSSTYSNFYLADIHFIDGQALTPSSFTETSATTGQLLPRQYTGSFGTNGFWLKFSDNSNTTATTLGKDTSGNNNNWDCFNLQTTTGGPTSVAAASGALPIYNTTGTYGDTKGSGTRTDANASSLVLAIPMDGANNGTTFTDESATIRGSGSAKTLTRTGFITSTAQSKYYGSAGFSDTNYNSITVASSTDFDFGTGNFTIECWIHPVSITSYGMIFQTAGSNTAGSVYLLLSPIGTAVFETFTGSSRPSVSQTGVIQNAWNHIAAIRSGNNWTVYVNGVAGSSAAITQSLTSATPRIGSNADESGNGRFNGYIQDLRIYKGVAKYTSNFNPPNSTQNATVAAGNDSLVDTPVSSGTDDSLGGSVRGNYATLNPLAYTGTAAFSNGNLEVTLSSGEAAGTFLLDSGKYYWEITCGTITISPPTDAYYGLLQPFSYSGARNFAAGNIRAWRNAGTLYGTGSTGSVGSYTTGDILGFAYDGSSGKLYVSKNGTWQNSADPAVGTGAVFTGITTNTFVPGYSAAASTLITFNGGQRPFAYTAPSGFKALCDTNLPAPVVAKPSEVMDVKLYTGNGSTQNITGLGFSPDLVWIKSRSTGTLWHEVFDAIRGANNRLFTNATNAETTNNTLSSFNSNGFTLSITDSNGYGVNLNNDSYVAWAWDAGTTTTTNTQGSITSSVLANASAGFSIVSFTTQASGSATVGHGLGVAPTFFITKARGVSNNWWCYHASLSTPQSNAIALNLTNAELGSTTLWNNTAPTSSVINLGSDWAGSNALILYAFAPVSGYSSFGSYTGNGSADGPFVYTGFRPRWVLIKSSSVAGESWFLLDTSRSPYNVSQEYLMPNSSAAETSAYTIMDILSNGFKLKTSGGGSAFNGSGATYIYACFAESPFQYARAR